MNSHLLLQDIDQIKAIESIKRVDQNGFLYYMDCCYDYYMLKDSFHLFTKPGCSSFAIKNLNDEVLLCRNYDNTFYKNNDKSNPITGINMIINNHNPNAKYQSIGVADCYWLDYKNATFYNGCIDDGITDLSSLVLAPYLCMDGVNEKGFAVSIMALNVDAKWEEIEYEFAEKIKQKDKLNLVFEETGRIPQMKDRKVSDGSIAVNIVDHKAWVASKPFIETNMPNKEKVLPPILMRMMLDNCANVQEAILLADKFNIITPDKGCDYHILLVDKENHHVLLEWGNNQMNVVDINHATNHRVSMDDVYHGYCPRDEIIQAALARANNDKISEEYAESILRLIAQDPSDGFDTTKTQYSCIYNLDKHALKIYSFGDFRKSWIFNL